MGITDIFKSAIIKILPKSIKQEIEKPYLDAILSYAQEGEDLILTRLLEGKRAGFYVDVGAHHPVRFSNTYYFYKKGWQGINIDAMPNSMTPFNKLRPRDINLEVGIGKEATSSTFFIFNEPALNTFSETEAQAKDGLDDYYIIDNKEVRIQPIREILDKHLLEGQVIDFLSIDAEGKDLEVLQSNNWDKYRPTFVLVEDLQRMEVEKMITSSLLYRFMRDVRYRLVAKTYNTLFFQKVQ